MSRAEHLRLVSPPEPDDPIAAALARADSRTRVLAVIAGYRAARDAFEVELRASREHCERLLVGLEQWGKGGELPEDTRHMVAVVQEADSCKSQCGRCATCEYGELFATFAFDDLALDLASEFQRRDWRTELMLCSRSGLSGRSKSGAWTFSQS